MAAYNIPQPVSSASGYVVHVESATGLRNADGMFSKSDPYVRIICGPVNAVGSVIKNNLNPVHHKLEHLTSLNAFLFSDLT